MQIPSFQRQVKASEVPLEKLSNNSKLTQQDKLKEVSRQFEAILLRQVLTEAQKPLVKSKYNNSSVAGEVYRDLITNEMADQISRSGSLGLGHSLDKQLQHQFKSTGKPGATPSKPADATSHKPNHLPEV